MKKISLFIAAFAFMVSFTAAPVVHAQTQTSATVDVSAGASVNGVGDIRKPGTDKPGTILLMPALIDAKPMPKDPAAQAALKKRIADIEAGVKNARAKCDTLATKVAQSDCIAKAEAEIKKVQGAFTSEFFTSPEEMKRKMEEDRPKTDGERKEDRMMGAKNSAENVIRELSALYSRFSEIANRIEERMKTLSSKNISVEVSEKYMTAARADLAKARTEIDAIGAIVKTDTSATLTTATEKNEKSDNAALMTKTRTHLKAAKEALISAHKNLMNAVRNLKPLPSETKVDASVKTNVKATVQPI